MGTDMYQAHDWSYVTLSLMLLGMVVAVFAAMALFLYMVGRASEASVPPRESRDTEPRADRDDARAVTSTVPPTEGSPDVSPTDHQSAA
ncbi:MAG TPA: hypothetical protein PLZ93_05815 [Nocardioides sp.]|uniref:hypothetical protein n=1 Tax=uncultured Nocardioides sp. TaxID=198441 RepID=UPI000EDB0DF2|nr:hypothetical protein [uncultured Nocardioides sp.]HAP74838.1 hypothetical protein [Acidimicrobiaceae bacterium]HCB04943.1 hypothetical protein [Nocardioides sp.]HRD61556.1 hypothetical protein [Nocardioides sp.]HRI95107.1 hypothetical protein [Nocardioides sp.]HRK45999.1 hypothetical protein [Nocardioides sp.]